MLAHVFEVLQWGGEIFFFRFSTLSPPLTDLKNMGEQNASTLDTKPLTYDQILSTLAIYHSMYQSDTDKNIAYAGQTQENPVNKLDEIDEHYIESEIKHDPEAAAKRIREQLDAIPATMVTPFSVNATFDIMNGIGWKPHHSQSVPKEPGSTEKGFRLHPDQK